MPQQLLGKRLRSHGRVPSPPSCSSRNATPRKTRRSLPSPEPTPEPKRVRLSTSELVDDDSNKENIPPESLQCSTSLSGTFTVSDANIVTPRAQRATRRASLQHPQPKSPARRCVSSSVTRISPSPPPASSTSTEFDTPTKTLSRLSLATPPTTPQSILSTTLPKSQPLHVRVRTLLHPQNQESLPLVGREVERAKILDFLKPFILGNFCEDDATSLYISGAPGTGKTALVNDILTNLSPDPALRVIYINCVSHECKDGLSGIWKCCANELGVAESSKRGIHKADWVQEFGRLMEGHKCIVVLDEIDHLMANMTSACEVFSLTTVPRIRSNLRIIGISNIHTLTDSKLSACTRTVHFEPYTAMQMKAVLLARLAALPLDNLAASKIFPLSTITILTMKIANQTGDIRSVFSVARRALDIAVTASASSSPPTVMPSHVLSALQASQTTFANSQGKTGAGLVTRIRSLGLQHRFALVALLLATKRLLAGLSLTGSGSSNNGVKDSTDIAGNAPTIDITTLHGFYCTMLSRGFTATFTAVNRTEFSDLVNLLDGNGLISISLARGKAKIKGNSSQLVSIASGVREEELVRGLTGSLNGDTSLSGDLKEEEVMHIWQKELARLGREISAKVSTKIKADFEGAMED